MVENGYTVINTKGEDIDNDQSVLQNENYDVFTGFEIFEHLLNPYTVLPNVKADKILISIPLRLWFFLRIEVKPICGTVIIMNLKIGN